MKLPDYLGKAFSLLGDACFNAMDAGKNDIFKRIFPSFFVASLSYAQRAPKLIPTADDKTKLILFSEPIVDLLALSGASTIYSELNQSDFRDSVQSTWDKYLEQADTIANFSKLLAMLDFRDSLSMRFPRNMVRMGWQQQINARLHSRGLLRDFEPYYSDDESESAKSFGTPLLREISGSFGIYDKLEDIFLATYLMKRNEFANLQFPSVATRLAERLARHSKEKD